MNKKHAATDTTSKDLPHAGVWEVSIGDSPIPLPIAVPTIVIVEHSSYFVLGIEAQQNNGTAALRNTIMRIIAQHQVIPASFMVKSADADALRPIAQELGVPCEVATKLPAIANIRSMLTRMTGVSMSKKMPKQRISKRSLATKGTKHKGDKTAGSRVLQFKITLRDISPAVWRRIRVPADFSFGELSIAIMEAFGWTPGYHLHGYSVQPTGAKTREFISIGPPNPDGDDFGDSRDEREEMIADYFDTKIKQCTFTYDFGDSWDHAVLFEGAFPAEKGVKYPQLLGGKSATPPEDCGGPWGYADMLKKLKNPKHPEHTDILEWLSLDDAEDFDPKAFDPEEVHFSTRKNCAKFLKKYDGSVLL